MGKSLGITLGGMQASSSVEVGEKCQLSKLFTQLLPRVEHKSQIFESSALDSWVTALRLWMKVIVFHKTPQKNNCIPQNPLKN